VEDNIEGDLGGSKFEVIDWIHVLRMGYRRIPRKILTHNPKIRQ
jgi:hypothetical protein